MKCIILAAGEGARIAQVTKKKPKCLIEINGKTILERQINFLRRLNIKDIIVITGFKKKKINFKNIKYVVNKNYKNNEQLESLFSAKKEFNDEVIITFADTIYDFSVIKKLYASRNGDIILGIDKKWKKRYKFRYDHPYAQADKVQINKEGQVLKIGKKIHMQNTNAEFLGLLKLTTNGCKIFLKNYKILKKKKDINKMQVHNFIQDLVKNNQKVFSCSINGKFMEIDTFNDYNLAKKLFAN
jgi:L-glutamine-phosphate cytidylyltransferase